MSVQPVDDREGSSAEYCRLQDSSSSSRSSSAIKHIHDTCCNDDDGINEPKEVRGLDFYLPLSSHVDDNPTITVYDEVKEMLLSAILMYGVVHLRALARKQQLKQEQQEQQIENSNEMNFSILAERLLSLPIDSKEVVRLVTKYREDIVAQVGRESTVDLYLTAFDAIQSSSSSRELELEMNHATSRISLVSFDVVVVEDENADSQLVYAICVDTARRRITVSFRGCSCRKDWFVCAQTILKKVDNPLYDESSRNSNASSLSSRRQPSTIAIHSGYYNYLFSSAAEGEEPKFDSIMRQLRSLQLQYPGYNVYVTGHSLGAALATVFSFHAAASSDLTDCVDSLQEAPVVTCINFASPMVGNIEFETAFRELENQGRIRCLRVTNYYDIFTQLPDRGNWLYFMAFIPWIEVHLLPYIAFAVLFFVCFQNNVYRHVGMNLQMYKGHKTWLCCWPFRRQQKGNDFAGDEADDNMYYWYKIKHSHGSANNFALRVVQDFKKHMKQLVQRALAIAFLTDFNANHSICNVSLG
jgi:hypothetical protein